MDPVADKLLVTADISFRPGGLGDEADAPAGCGPCPVPDTCATVVIRGRDSGVENRDTGDGCTINDLIDDESSWDSHGDFVSHVNDVTNQLRKDGVISNRESSQLTRAAVATFAFVLDDQPPLTPDGHEAQAALWIPLADLVRPDAAFRYRFGKVGRFPAIRHGEHVIAALACDPHLDRGLLPTGAVLGQVDRDAAEHEEALLVAVERLGVAVGQLPGGGDALAAVGLDVGGEGDGPAAVVAAAGGELAVADPVVDGVLGHLEAGGDGAVVQALGHQAQHGQLALRQLPARPHHPIRRCRAEEGRAQAGMHVLPAAGDLDVAQQVDSELLKKMTALANAVEKKFSTFRPKVDGKEMTDAQVREVLKKSTLSERRKEVWEASKEVGKVVEAELKDLVKLRNEAAVKLGFKNFHALQLYLNEQDGEALIKLFDELDDLTREPFRKAKTEIDVQLAKNCNVTVDELRPWHYHDPFFQETPAVFAADIDGPYARADILKICRDFYAGIGLPIDRVLDRSDLYEKKGKSPHAFCTDINRAGDVRDQDFSRLTGTVWSSHPHV